MWDEVTTLLRGAPEVALFLALAGGYALGGVRLGRLTLGATVATLLTALLIGQVGLTVDPLLKSTLFALFIFTVGYGSGPQFFASFKGNAGPQLAFAIVLAVSATLLTVVLARVMGLDKGAAAGLFAGALTQSPALGTASDAISRLGLSAADAKQLVDSAAVAYAVSYLFGEFGLLLFVRNLAPILMGVDLKKAAAALKQDELGNRAAELDRGQLLAYRPRPLRAYRVMRRDAAGATVSDIERAFGDGVIVDQIQRPSGAGSSAAVPVTAGTRLAIDDVIGIHGPRGVLAEHAVQIIGDEVDNEFTEKAILQTLDAVVTNRGFAGLSLREIATRFGERTRGLVVLSIHRGEQNLPVMPSTKLAVGDVVKLVGDQAHVTAAASTLGYADWPSDKSDLVYLGLGIALGTLLGSVSVAIGGVPLTLGSGGGVLVAGLIFGWLRAQRPTFGKLPGPAQWILKDFGLNGFIATIGLSIGPSAVDAVMKNGATLLLAGVILTLVPLVITMYFGKLVLKMNPVILCGALAGAQTNAAVLTAVSDVSDSNLPVLGFTLPFAINNMLLTVAAPIIVALI